MNLLWKTYFKCILLCNCNNTVVIRLTNKRAQIASSTNNLVWHSKKMRALVRGKKISSRSWPCELDKGRSLWEINCSLWPCKDVTNKLLWFSWHNYIVALIHYWSNLPEFYFFLDYFLTFTIFFNKLLRSCTKKCSLTNSLFMPFFCTN